MVCRHNRTTSHQRNVTQLLLMAAGYWLLRSLNEKWTILKCVQQLLMI